MNRLFYMFLSKNRKILIQTLLCIWKMVTWERYSIVGILCFVNHLLQSSHTFIQRCPEMKELEKKRWIWNCSNLKEYHCLAVDVIKLNTYREECRTSDWVSIGNYPVFRGRYIDYETCPADSYQPVLFRSNEHFKCIYLKSNCSLEGQVEVNVGTTTSDKACRCDYKRGFAFVTRPRNQCACVPSKEDCSCYIKRCAEGQTLNSDYQCTPTAEIFGSTTCNVIKLTDTTDVNPNNSSIFKTILINVVTPNDMLERGLIHLMTLFAIFVTLVFDIMVIICVLFCQCGLCFRKQAEKSYPVLSEISTVIPRKPLSLSESNYSTTGEKSGVYIQRNRIDNDKKDNWKREEQKECTQKSDIIILHDDAELLIVNIFKGRLTYSAHEEGYFDIKLFENVFPTTGTFLIQDVIKHCKLLIFFISGNDFATYVKRYGLTESDIESNIPMPHKYPMIRTVGANKGLNFKTDMDYSKYIDRTSDTTSYKNELKSILKGKVSAENVIK